MTRDDIIRMAREADASFETAESMFRFAALAFGPVDAALQPARQGGLAAHTCPHDSRASTFSMVR